jgi:hypothetical protein
MASESTPSAVALPKLVRSLKLTLIASYAHFVIEWLFFVTKPSTLNILTVPEQLAVLFITPLPWMLLASVTVLGVDFPAYLALWRHPTTRG